MESKWLILQRSKELNINRLKLAKEIGFTSEKAGLKKINKILDEGLWEIKLIKPLAAALKISELALINSMLEEINRLINTLHQKEIKEFNEFIPYLYSFHEKKPIGGPSWSVGYDLHKKQISLGSKFKQLSKNEKLEFIKRSIQKHYNFYNGTIGRFGKIEYYVLFNNTINLDFDRRAEFDIEGNQIFREEIKASAPKETSQSKPLATILPLKEDLTKLKDLREQIYQYMETICGK